MAIFNILNNNNNNCCCNNRNLIIRRRSGNNTSIQNERVAQFHSMNNIIVNSGDIIPITVNQFNNISDIVETEAGVINILSQGSYEIEYTAVIQNISTETQNAVIMLEVNGVQNTMATSIATINSNEYATVFNKTIITVVSGATSTIQLSNGTLGDLLIVNSNITVTKLT